PALPSSWASFETVVVLRIDPQFVWPDKSKGSGGRSHLLIIHPPSATPAFSTVYLEKTKPSAATIDGSRLGIWLKNHLTFRKAQP
ncbi:MAG TPA: hypothetical protein VLC09_17550, partial [Polyangiaceae bacterium]|nr:hypothetical protein [Polyangiaceae bacterium]